MKLFVFLKKLCWSFYIKYKHNISPEKPHLMHTLTLEIIINQPAKSSNNSLNSFKQKDVNIYLVIATYSFSTDLNTLRSHCLTYEQWGFSILDSDDLNIKSLFCIIKVSSFILIYVHSEVKLNIFNLKLKKLYLTSAM